MKFDRFIGLWRDIGDEIIPNIPLKPNDISEEESETEKETENRPLSPPPDLKGSCTLAIRFNNHGEYLKWAKYNPGRTWEFLVSYPAIMRARYSFKNALEVEMLAKKIVQLLTFGFDVYSASWELETNTENEEGNEEE